MSENENVDTEKNENRKESRKVTRFEEKMESERNTRKPTRKETRIYTRKKTFLNNKTFATKLLLKLTETILDPIVTCVSILKFEPQNRKNEEIKKTLPWITTLKEFCNFILAKEEELNYLNILMEFAWILFYKYAPKYSVIKRASENPNFYLILNGSCIELTLVYRNECLTENDYIKHLIKMNILNEKEIINRCLLYNKKELNIKSIETIENFCLSEGFDYKKLKKVAERELMEIGYDLDNINRSPSVEKYITATSVENELKKTSNEHCAKKYFFIPHYEITGNLEKGRFIGNLSSDCSVKEQKAYLSLDASDIGYINKAEYKDAKIFKLIKGKMRKIFRDDYNSFFLFKELKQENFLKNYAKGIIYKQYNKGEKVFSQNSLSQGVFLIKEGEIQLSTKRKLDEINGLITLLQNSLNGFGEYISSIKGTKSEMDNLNPFSNPIFQSKEYIEEIKGVKEIILCKFHEGEIVGLNDCYHFKNELYHFDAVCTSERLLLYFVPKGLLTTMISREQCVRDAVIKTVELKCALYIGSLNNYKNILIKNVAFKIGKIDLLYKESKNNNNMNKIGVSKSTLNKKPFNQLLQGDQKYPERFKINYLINNNNNNNNNNKNKDNENNDDSINNSSIRNNNNKRNENISLKNFAFKRNGSQSLNYSYFYVSQNELNNNSLQISKQPTKILDSSIPIKTKNTVKSFYDEKKSSLPANKNIIKKSQTEIISPINLNLNKKNSSKI